MKNRFPTVPLILILFSALFAGCAFREAPARTAIPEAAPALPEETAGPVPEVIQYTVRFFAENTELCSASVEAGAVCPSPEIDCDGYTVIGWCDRDGRSVDLSALTVTESTELFAVIRPVLPGDVKLLAVRESGLPEPHSVLSHADIRFGVTALLGDDAAALFTECGVPTESGDAGAEECRAVLNALFDPDAVAALWESAADGEETSLTRVEWVSLINELLPGEPAEADFYSPDISPDDPGYAALARFCTAPEFSAEELAAQAADGFLWLDGYLYALDEEGHFLRDTEQDGLLFGSDGRYTSTNAELDEYVASAIREYCKPDLTRRENLKLLYDHVKNDFRYLTRNYYASGAVGWDIDEALTLFSTGKGNCYCYAGVFCHLARGLGYNARTYSGSIGVENQPHAWTEITLEDEIYICDPEIEMNYWYLQMYTDNFMMNRKNAGGWNYQSVGRNP